MTKLQPEPLRVMKSSVFEKALRSLYGVSVFQVPVVPSVSLVMLNGMTMVHFQGPKTWHMAGPSVQNQGLLPNCEVVVTSPRTVSLDSM